MIRSICLLSAAIYLLSALAMAQPGGGPVVPLDALEPAAPKPSATPTRSPTPTPTLTPTPRPTPTIQVELEQIRVIRTRKFTSTVPGGRLPTAVMPGAGGQMMRSPWQSGMVFQFRLLPAENWNLISVDRVRLVKVLDQQGNSLIAGGRGGSGFNLLSPMDEIAEGPRLELHADLPPRTDEQLQLLHADFRVTLGYVVKHKFSHIRQLAGQRLTQPTENPKFELVIDEVGEDVITIRTVGDIDRIGDLIFENASYEPLEPYATEGSMEAGSDGRPQKTWRYSFFELPQVVRLDVEFYSELREQTVTFERVGIELP